MENKINVSLVFLLKHENIICTSSKNNLAKYLIVMFKKKKRNPDIKFAFELTYDKISLIEQEHSFMD